MPFLSLLLTFTKSKMQRSISVALFFSLMQNPKRSEAVALFFSLMQNPKRREALSVALNNQGNLMIIY
jgi:hypothetical protein